MTSQRPIEGGSMTRTLIIGMIMLVAVAVLRSLVPLAKWGPDRRRPFM